MFNIYIKMLFKNLFCSDRSASPDNKSRSRSRSRSASPKNGNASPDRNTESMDD